MARTLKYSNPEVTYSEGIWAEVINSVIYILNRTSSIENSSPTKNEELKRLKSDIDQTLKSVLTKIQEFEIKFDMQDLSRSHKNPADHRPLENMETKTAGLIPRNKTWLHPVQKNKQTTGQQKQIKSVVKVRTVYSKKQSKDMTVIVCFEVYHAFNVEYPIEADCVWTFLQI